MGVLVFGGDNSLKSNDVLWKNLPTTKKINVSSSIIYDTEKFFLHEN